MPKLSKDKNEFCRLEKKVTGKELQDNLIDYRKTTLSFLLDKNVLEKIDIQYLPDELNVNGYKISHGWKFKIKIPEDKDIESVIKIMENKFGYRKLKGNKLC